MTGLSISRRKSAGRSRRNVAWPHSRRYEFHIGIQSNQPVNQKKHFAMQFFIDWYPILWFQ
jgi:hypothetical protein